MVGDHAGFGAVLGRLRTAAGFAQQPLAERAGLSLRRVSDLEQGVRRVPHGRVERLTEALDLGAADQAALRAAGRS